MKRIQASGPTMTIQRVARQGHATARTREHQTGGIDRRKRPARPRVPGRPELTDRCHGRPKRNRVERDGRPESLPSINVSQGEFSPMLKPLTLSLSLAVALGFCSVSMAGGHDDNCTTCGLASPRASSPVPRAWSRLRGALPPQEALLQFPPAEDSLQPAEVPSQVQLRVGPEEEAQLVASRTQAAATPAAVRLRCIRPARALLLRRASMLRPPVSMPLRRSTVLASMPSCLPGRQPPSPRSPPR